MTMAEDRRHVVFVSQHYPPDKGGNATRIHDLATYLVDHGWQVTVLAPPASFPPGEFDRSWQHRRTESVDGVMIHRLWTWQPQTENPGMRHRLAYYLLFGIHAMVWLLWSIRRYDAVVTTTPPISTGAPGLLARLLGKPWVVDVRDRWIDASVSLGYLEEGSRIERISRRFQRLVLHTADRISVTTPQLEMAIRESYGNSLGEKTTLLPNGVDVKRFQAHRNQTEYSPTERNQTGKNHVESNQTRRNHTEREQDRELYAVKGGSGAGTPEPADGGERVPSVESGAKADGGGETIIYTGNLGSAQDLESVIRAMSHLSHDGASLQLVGGGDVESELRQLTDELGIGDTVEFAGVVRREEVPTFLDQATVGIAPLKDTDELAYAIPTKVYEYMASCLPTVVTGCGEIERFVDESGGGVHVANDPEQIAQQLDELLEDDTRRQQLAERGREYVETNYDRKAIARHLGDELAQLVEDERAR